MRRFLRTRTARRSVVATALVAVVVGVTAAQPASAVDPVFPTWAEVEAARGDESAKRAQIAEIEALIVSTAAAVQTAADEQLRLAEQADATQVAADEALMEYERLDALRGDAELEAQRSSQLAGQLGAWLARTGGTELSTLPFLAADGADDTLTRLAAGQRVGALAGELTATAERDANAFRAAVAQAEVANAERVRRNDAAQAALRSAADAVAALEAQRAAQQEQQAVFAAQLDVLEQDRAATEADYTAGVAYRMQQEAERQQRLDEERRAAAEQTERARQAAIAAAQAAVDAGSDEPVPAYDLGESAEGWTLPAVGPVTSRYGPRVAPVAGGSTWHLGVDIGSACGNLVRAATAGTVSYAGWLGSYGYLVVLDHGGGVQTAYAHNSRLTVANGDRVTAGDTIALIGTTGASSGCHSHVEVRTNGSKVDPTPYFAARGVVFGR